MEHPHACTALTSPHSLHAGAHPCRLRTGPPQLRITEADARGSFVASGQGGASGGVRRVPLRARAVARPHCPPPRPSFCKPPAAGQQRSVAYRRTDVSLLQVADRDSGTAVLRISAPARRCCNVGGGAAAGGVRRTLAHGSCGATRGNHPSGGVGRCGVGEYQSRGAQQLPRRDGCGGGWPLPLAAVARTQDCIPPPSPPPPPHV